MTLADRVQLIVQQHLAANNEDAMWLRGPKGRDWNGAYERVLDAVHRTLIREIDWREWVGMQSQVLGIVKGLFESGQRGGT